MKLPVTSGAVAILGIVFGIPLLWAQNLGDVAREDRERRSRLSTHSPVLTNEDLARDRILTPELKNRILRTQAGSGATVPLEGAAAQIAEEQVPPAVTIRMIQELRPAALPPLFSEAVQPAAVAAQALPLQSPTYTEPAVAATAAVDEPVSVGDYQIRAVAVQPPDVEVIQPAAVAAQTLATQTPSYTEPAVAATVDEPVSIGDYQIRAAAVQSPDVEVIQPAAVAAQTLAAQRQSYTEPAVGNTAAVEEAVSLGEYARQLRAFRVAHVSVQPLDAGTAETAGATHDEEISLGQFARQLRSERVAHLDLQTPDAAPEAAVADRRPDDGLSLGEYARQLPLRFAPELLVAPAPSTQETAADAGQPVSLGEYARQLRAVRAVPADESASITPLPPQPEVRDLQPEISLGEYARQLRIRHAADEYLRLLAQDDASLDAALAGDATAPLRYHEIRSTAAAPALRQRRVVETVVAPKKSSTPDAQGHIAVTVRRGDSLWRLARTYLGLGARWRSISFLKRHSGSPDLIRVGEVILIPVFDGERGQTSDVSTRLRKNLLPN